MAPGPELTREVGRRPHFGARGPIAPLTGWKLLQATAAKALGQGDVERAAHLLVEAIELAPTEPRLYEQLVRVALLGGATDTAVQAALELRRLDPTSAQFGHLQAMALLAHGDEAGAQAVLEQVLLAAPGHVEACRALAQLARGRQDPALAVELLQGPWRAAPGDSGLAIDYGLSLLDAQRADEARAVLDPLVAAHPEAHAARLALARACAKVGDLPGARSHAQRAKDTDDGEVREQAVHLARQLRA